MIIIILDANISPLLVIGLHEGRALFATFTSLNPLTRPGTLSKSGVWSSFIQSCSLHPGISVYTIKRRKRSVQGLTTQWHRAGAP